MKPKMVSQLNFEGKDKVQMAIERLKTYEPVDGFWLAFSGGKDSVVLYDLAVKSEVKFTAHYNLTTVDPPELVRFIKQEYPQVIVEHPKKTMWQLIEKNGLPYRNRRFCCRKLKESAGVGAILTGIRREESPRRGKRCVFEYDKHNNDKWYIHPIYDWLKTEVWSYIWTNGISYCKLYDEGYERIGCMLCPFSKQTEKQLIIAKYPQVVEAYRRAHSRFCEVHPAKSYDTTEKAFDRWLYETPITKKEQISLFV